MDYVGIDVEARSREPVVPIYEFVEENLISDMSVDTSDTWCRISDGDTSVGTLTLTIENFESRLEEPGCCTKPTVFTVRGNDEKTTKWKLKLYPRGCKNSDPNYVAIILRSDNDFEVKAKYSFSILDSSSRKIKRKERIKMFNKLGDSWGWNKFISWAMLTSTPDLLPGGHLTILCEVKVFGLEKITTGSRFYVDKPKTRAKGQKQVCDQLGKLFTDQEFSDVEVECDGSVFHCHRPIIAARSDVFRAMFQSDMTENLKKKVTIKAWVYIR